MECPKCNGTGQINRLGLVIDPHVRGPEGDAGERPVIRQQEPGEHLPREERWTEPGEPVTCPRCHGTGEILGREIREGAKDKD